jgi:hypothetical protein
MHVVQCTDVLLPMSAHVFEVSPVLYMCSCELVLLCDSGFGLPRQ